MAFDPRINARQGFSFTTARDLSPFEAANLGFTLQNVAQVEKIESVDSGGGELIILVTTRFDAAAGWRRADIVRMRDTFIGFLRGYNGLYPVAGSVTAGIVSDRDLGIANIKALEGVGSTLEAGGNALKRAGEVVDNTLKKAADTVGGTAANLIRPLMLPIIIAIAAGVAVYVITKKRA
jgi:hypothetical protein